MADSTPIAAQIVERIQWELLHAYAFLRTSSPAVVDAAVHMPPPSSSVAGASGQELPNAENIVLLLRRASFLVNCVAHSHIGDVDGLNRWIEAATDPSSHVEDTPPPYNSLHLFANTAFNILGRAAVNHLHWLLRSALLDNDHKSADAVRAQKIFYSAGGVLPPETAGERPVRMGGLAANVAWVLREAWLLVDVDAEDPLANRNANLLDDFRLDDRLGELDHRFLGRDPTADDAGGSSLVHDAVLHGGRPSAPISTVAVASQKAGALLVVGARGTAGAKLLTSMASMRDARKRLGSAPGGAVAIDTALSDLDLSRLPRSIRDRFYEPRLHIIRPFLLASGQRASFNQYQPWINSMRRRNFRSLALYVVRGLVDQAVLVGAMAAILSVTLPVFTVETDFRAGFSNLLESQLTVQRDVPVPLKDAGEASMAAARYVLSRFRDTRLFGSVVPAEPSQTALIAVAGSLLLAAEALRQLGQNAVSTLLEELLSQAEAIRRETLLRRLMMTLGRAPLAFFDACTSLTLDRILAAPEQLANTDSTARRQLLGFVLNAVMVHRVVRQLVMDAALRTTIGVDAMAPRRAVAFGLAGAWAAIVGARITETVATRAIAWAAKRRRVALATLRALETAATRDGGEEDSAPVAFVGFGPLISPQDVVRHIRVLRPHAADAVLLAPLQRQEDALALPAAPPEAAAGRLASLGSAIVSIGWRQLVSSGMVGMAMKQFGSVVRFEPRRPGWTYAGLQLWQWALAAIPIVGTAVTNVVTFALPSVFSCGIHYYTNGSVQVSSWTEVHSRLHKFILVANTTRKWLRECNKTAHQAHHIERLLSQFNENAASRNAATVSSSSRHDIAADVASGKRRVTALIAQGLEFAYPSRPDVRVIRDLTICIPTGPGQLVALTGPSGCGKSTLLSLFLGLYDDAAWKPEALCMQTDVGQGGTDDPSEPPSLVPIASLLKDQTLLRRRIFGFVPQQPTVIAGATVLDNVVLGRTSPSRDHAVIDAVRDALRISGCDEFLSRCPEGLFTQLSSHGVALSGGQVQRLAFARALVWKPRMILCDEPTAALDDDAARHLLTSLKAMATASECCVIAVTHDHRVLLAADHVVKWPSSSTLQSPA